MANSLYEAMLEAQRREQRGIYDAQNPVASALLQSVQPPNSSVHSNLISQALSGKPSTSARYGNIPSSGYPNQTGVFDRAMSQYPILQAIGLSGVSSPGKSDAYLEFWPPDEPGSGDYMRPSSIPIGAPGVEIYREDTRPIDVLGDVASHYLVNNDPIVERAYNVFQNSLEPWQEQNLRAQYEESGDRRPYKEWREISGLPAYFRGWTFDQWGENSDQYYTPQQLQVLGMVKSYLTNR